MAKKNKSQSVRITVSFAVNTNPFDRQLWKLLNNNDRDFLDKYSLESNDSISIRIKRIALSVINNEFNGSNTRVETTEINEPITTTLKEKPQKKQQTEVPKPKKNNLLNPLNEAVTLSLDDLA